MTISVDSSGTIESVVCRDSGQLVDQTVFGGFESVSGLFGLIQQAINLEAASISVEYDPEVGYPLSVYIDYDERIADEERGFEVSIVTSG